MKKAVAIVLVIASLGVWVVWRLAGVAVSVDPDLRTTRPGAKGEAVSYKLDWGTTSARLTYEVRLLEVAHHSDDRGEMLWSSDKAKPERLTWRGPDTLVVGVGMADFDRRRKIKVSAGRGVTVLTEWLSVRDSTLRP